jgi:hypothetical protein
MQMRQVWPWSPYWRSDIGQLRSKLELCGWDRERSWNFEGEEMAIVPLEKKK